MRSQRLSCYYFVAPHEVRNRGNGLDRTTSTFTPYETDDVLLDTGSMTVRLTFAEDERLPYWAELWPSAIGLAHYLDRDVSLRGKHVLELGCGLGLLGVIAARDGARVLCTDYEPDALALHATTRCKTVVAIFTIGWWTGVTQPSNDDTT